MKPLLKKILESFGLLGFAQCLLRNLTWGAVVSFFINWRNYIYNHGITHVPIHWIRVLYLRSFMGIRVGKGSFIHMGVFLTGKISIGDHSVIGRKCSLIGDIEIGNNVSITAETYIFTSSHEVNSPDFRCFYTKVVLEDCVWIGARAMILPGVTIQKGAVLGAASVATKSILPFSICVGSPAREIGKRNADLEYTIDYRPFFN
jgi:acetyltransferase-like isoleucine patch superfamily enzyme